MSNLTKAIAREEAVIAALEKAQEKDTKETQEAIKAWERYKTNSIKGLKGTPKTFSALTVSWEEDGTQYTLGPEKPLSIVEFRKALASVPTVVHRHMAARLAPGPAPKSPRELSKDFSRRQQERETKIFHAQERLRDLKG